ncbi:MAG: hypothetical protein H6626_13320 [Pseudobdellovibrionaceae bacterium]|nr:hypothetical protein [Bdellovibrionales bacterium]USN47152.1 MAG: hypothetical protein H6626_13320 [Pseudobdellovibrionaceae bacterium]
MGKESFAESCFGHLKILFPDAAAAGRSAFPLEYLAGAQTVNLSPSLYGKIQKAIADTFAWTHTDSYADQLRPHLSKQDQEILDFKTEQFSVLMAYDFHVDPNTQQARLIEVNTNGAGYLFAYLSYLTHGLKPFPQINPLMVLKNSFTSELQLFNGGGTSHILIMDETLKQQKMYPEFLLYEDLFRQWGFSASLIDFEDLEFHAQTNKVAGGNFIYNRYCDFLLRERRSEKLRAAYLTKVVGLSPQPKEYLLIADKQRMVEWGLAPDLPDTIAEVLLKTKDISEFSDPDTLWTERKHWFFKPKRSHGGKSTYRGKSITKGTFERLLKEDTLVQEYFPAAETEDGQWKYDIRFYVYKDRIQLATARVYKGQVTNFSTPQGGFAPIVVSG